MDKSTTDKLFAILRYVSKTKISNLFQISRNTFYSRLKDNNWKSYQIEMIDNWYNTIKGVEKINKNVKINKIRFNGKSMIISTDILMNS